VPVYVTAKAAIMGMTRTLAHELGPSNIRVNCVMPGLHPDRAPTAAVAHAGVRGGSAGRAGAQRFILPEEVARLVLFLAADDSSAITNQSYVIDGGWV